MKELVAVTGATGFLGSHITEALIANGYKVKILAQDKNKAEAFHSKVESVVIGDIADRNALDSLCKDAAFVIHLVSNFRVASGSQESYHTINVLGTERVLEAAQKAGVQRFIHCSTIGVHGDVKTTPANEQSPFNPGDLYQKTKLEAEIKVTNFAKKSPMEIVVIRPCSLYGPGDMRMLKMFKMLKKRTFFIVGPCKENFHALYIDDAVDGFLKALTQPGLNRDIFILGGPDGYLPLIDYIKKAAQAVGAPMPFLKFPYWFFYSAACLCELIFVPLRKEPPLHRRRVRFFRNNRAFSTQKAQETLCFTPQVNLDYGMRKTVEWYRKKGLL